MTGGAAAASSNGPRYAPDDPSLPKPWRGLVDGSTGYLYYWNPETNVTQYERPAAAEDFPPPPPLLPPPPPRPPPKSASVVVAPADHRHHDDDARHSRSRAHQHGAARGAGHGHGAQDSRAPSTRGHGASSESGSVDGYRRLHEISVTGENIPAPYMTFDSTGFPSEILKEVHYAGFSAPTPIQAQAWPIALQSRDIVAIAKTGSGKTLGYLIPGFIHLKRLRNNGKIGPTVLVLAPTRELATQIQDEAVKFGKSSRISCTCLYGGAPKGPQLRDLDRGVDVVVATPGRLNDILEMRRVSLRQVSYLVLDEADRMLDMGFEPQIRKIVKEIPNKRQTLMFTATWPKEVRKIAADLLVHPVQVNIGSIDELVANNSITQYVEVITSSEKLRRLEQILRSQDPGSKVIIFCSTKRMCDQLARTLTRQFGAAAIHGDKSQGERDRVLSQFRTGRSPILVATDVAARGLDIKDIRVVINYDFPTGVEDYVHRIGRTGRAGATGVSYTFFCDQDSKYAADLVKVLEGANQRVPQDLRDMVSRGGYGGKSRRWGSRSGARDGGRSHGGRSDSTYSGRGGRGPPPSSGRSDSGRRSRGCDDNEARDRYGRSNQDGHEADVRGRRSRGRGQGQSPSPSRSRSRSHSPKKELGARGNNSRSRSRSRSWNHRRSRSRSRSGSASRGFGRYGGGGRGSARGESPPPKRVHSPSNHHAGRPVDSPMHPQQLQQQQQQQQRSPPFDDGNRREIKLNHLHSPQKEGSGSPYNRQENGREGESSSPARRHQTTSPHDHEDNERPKQGSTQSLSVPHDRNADEEEEGMIPPDEEDGVILPEDGMASPRRETAKEPDPLR